MSNVERTAINADGSLGPWRITTSITIPRSALAGVAAKGYLYTLGGVSQSELSSVERAAITIDITAPTADSLSINGGALNSTSTNVTVTMSAYDSGSGVAEMGFSNDGSNWSDWQPYAILASWLLETGDGLKTVYGRVRDGARHVSSVVSDTIEVDTTVTPEYGLTINDGALFTNKVTVTLTIGAQPGMAQMQVSNDGGFAGAEWEPYASRKAWKITQYGDYVIPRVVYIRFKDVSGNTSATNQDDIILDINAPTGAMEIVTLNRSRRELRTADAISVTLLLSAEDDVSGVADMMISNHSDFTSVSWEPYTTTRGWSVPEGTKTTVYARFIDNAGNVSETYSDTTGQMYIYLPLVMRLYVTP